MNIYKNHDDSDNCILITLYLIASSILCIDIGKEIFQFLGALMLIINLLNRK